MPFVKLDCNILASTLWIDRDARDVFLTALLMAEPHELRTETTVFDPATGEPALWSLPAGWYGFAPVAGVGIIVRSGLTRELGMQALLRLCGPDPESRTPDHQGRRLARISGGYVVLNWSRYRERDMTSAERSRRWRESRKAKAAPDRSGGAE